MPAWQARAAAAALFAAGFATFTLLYCVQPLLPEFCARFGLTPAASAWALSSATLALAFGLLGAAAASDRFGRLRVMTASLFAAGALGVACAAAPDFRALLLLRAALGLALAGVPSLAMTLVAETLPRAAAQAAIGQFIAGSAFGGMSGRFIAAQLLDWGGWRCALLGIAAISLVAAAGFRLLAPAGAPDGHVAGTTAQAGRAAARRGGLVRIAAHLRDGQTAPLLLLAALLMGAFVSEYNFVAFRLQAPPLNLSARASGWVFLLYSLGIASSALSGRALARRGALAIIVAGLLLMILGAAISLASGLGPLICGTGCITMGFFAAHSAASATVAAQSVRAHNVRDHGVSGRAQASALYSTFYYLGSALLGPLGGVVFHGAGAAGLAAYTGALPLLGLACAGYWARAAAAGPGRGRV